MLDSGLRRRGDVPFLKAPVGAVGATPWRRQLPLGSPLRPSAGRRVYGIKLCSRDITLQYRVTEACGRRQPDGGESRSGLRAGQMKSADQWNWLCYMASYIVAVAL